MTAFRSRLAALLTAALVVGGVALPSAHAVAHGLEVLAEQAEHAATAHGASGDQAQTPCAPAPGDVDCGICTGLSAVAGLADAAARMPADAGEARSAYADWRRTAAASGAGARAPPVS